MDGWEVGREGGVSSKIHNRIRLVEPVKMTPICPYFRIAENWSLPLSFPPSLPPSLPPSPPPSSYRDVIHLPKQLKL